MKNCELSFVIVSFNSEHYLTEALKSIEKHASGISYEVIVVDNSTNPINLGVIQSNFSNVVIEKSRGNVGFGIANNRGVQLANSNNICLLNLDAKLAIDANKLISMLNEFENAIISGLMYDYDGVEVKPSFGSFPDKLLYTLRPTKMFDVFHKHIKEKKYFHADWVEGSFMLFHKDSWNRIGGFDPSIFMYGEDVILCKKASQLDIDRIVMMEKFYCHKGGYKHEREGLVYDGFRSYYKLCFTGWRQWFLRSQLFSVILIKSSALLILYLIKNDSVYLVRGKSLLASLRL